MSNYGIVPEILGPKRGRRKGTKKTGGRTKGGTNKMTKERAELMRAAVGSGTTPLEYMLGVMRDPLVDDERRDWAAQNAAPYIHPRLQAIAYKPMGEEADGKRMDDITLVRNLLFAVEMLKRKTAIEHESLPDTVDALPIVRETK